MARPPPLPIQHQVAAAVRGVRQGGGEVAKVRIEPDGTILIETTLALEPPAPEPVDEDGLDAEMRAFVERAKKI